MSIVVAVLCASVLLGLVAAVITATPSMLRAEAGMHSAGERQVERVIEARPGLRTWMRDHLHRRSAGVLMLMSLLVVVFAVAGVLGALLNMIDSNTGFARVDSAVARWGTSHATGASLTLVRWVTQLGSTIGIGIALLITAAADVWRRRQADVFAFIAAIVIGELVLANGLKVIVRRDRPNVTHLVAVSGFSFPSGHATSAAAAWAAIALVLGRSRSRRSRIILNGLAVLIAVAVATSRALLGVHWFTDVLAGLALGWGWYLMVSIAFGGRRQRLGEPVEEAVPDIDVDNARSSR